MGKNTVLRYGMVKSYKLFYRLYGLGHLNGLRINENCIVVKLSLFSKFEKVRRNFCLWLILPISGIFNKESHTEALYPRNVKLINISFQLMLIDIQTLR